MTRLKILLTILFAGCLMYACNDKNVVQVSLSDILEEKGFVDVSTLSKDQKQSYKKICELILSKLEFRDGSLKFTATKDEFTSEGISESLYSKWMKEIADANVAISKDAAMEQKLAEKFADMKARGLAKIKNW
ncbi:MAG: hypothetical protein LBD59_01555 [Prevotellaceae bacterium]|jgi:hypothetical protein|nr:hypothetical protein [Prevotellaceae bacterium]